MAILKARDGAALGDRPFVMGVLNVTPDSFSDGGEFMGEAAVHRAQAIADAGADVIDVGAESTRPGSEGVSPEEQLSRLSCVLEQVVAIGVPVSIDTMSARVAGWALDRGAVMVNDVSACRADPDMAALVADRGCPVVLMHMLGEPRTMQKDPKYPKGVVEEVVAFLRGRVRSVRRAGVARGQVILDPGIGFGKTVAHNLVLIRELRKLRGLGYPVLVGPSRKWFIGQITGAPVKERLPGSVAAAVASVLAGADMVRVHDVAETVPAVRVASAIMRGRWP